MRQNYKNMKAIALSLREIKCKNKRKRRERQKRCRVEFSCVKRKFFRKKEVYYHDELK